MKGISFAFILLVRQGTGVSLQGICEECVGGGGAWISGIFALCACFGPVVPLFGEPSFPKERTQSAQGPCLQQTAGEISLASVCNGGKSWWWFPTVYSSLPPFSHTLALQSVVSPCSLWACAPRPH